MGQHEIDPGVREFWRTIWNGTGIVAVLIFLAWILSDC